jgi:hypothetical protein
MWSAAMDVGGWLRGLGLGRYETVFREHAIGMDVLADLTDGELAQIGVPLGDRKRLLKAIASLPRLSRVSRRRKALLGTKPQCPRIQPQRPLSEAGTRNAVRSP